MELKLTLKLEGFGAMVEASAPLVFNRDLFLVEDPQRIRYSLLESTTPDHPVLVWSRNFVEFT